MTISEAPTSADQSGRQRVLCTAARLPLPTLLGLAPDIEAPIPQAARAIVKTCGLGFRVGVGEVSEELGDVVVADQAGGADRGVPVVVRMPRVGSVAA